MDTSTLISITGELQESEVIESQLPPLLGPLPLSEEDKRLSFNYYNVLELENCNFNNSSTSKEEGGFYFGHIYDTDIYRNKYIEFNAMEIESRPNPGSTPEKGVKWVDMTYHQIANMINNGWKYHFDTQLLEQVNTRFVLTLDPGVAVYFCHSVIWKMLGLFDAIKDIKESYKLTIPSEVVKFRGIGNKITGIKNKSASQKLEIKGTSGLTYTRLSVLYKRVAEALNADSNTSRSNYFFAIISFAHTRSYYKEFGSYSFPLELVPFGSGFRDSLKHAVTQYSKTIVELTKADDEPSISEMCDETFEVQVENDRFMMIKIGDEYRESGVTIFVVFNKQVRKFLGGRKSVDIKDGIILNPIDHRVIIMKDVFKYPFYLILMSTDDRSELQESMVNSRQRNIVAIIHSEHEFTTTQNIIKLRPSSYNKLVLKVLNNEFKEITETVFFTLLFRFKRDFIDNAFELDFKQWV